MANEFDELAPVDDLAAGLARLTSQLGQQTPAEPLASSVVLREDGSVEDSQGRTILPPHKARAGFISK